MMEQQDEAYEQRLIDLADNYATHKTAREEGFEEGKTEGRIEGKAEGRTEKETQIIKNLLNKGTMSILEIAEVAAVDEAFVLAIKDEMDNHDNEGINQ